MRFLIVNGDDLGASRGINRGILQAHRQGVLTSASLMVKARRSEEAADLAREARQLSVGLHVDIDQTSREPVALSEELERQLDRFQELMGMRPTHLDSHHNTHCL